MNIKHKKIKKPGFPIAIASGMTTKGKGSEARILPMLHFGGRVARDCDANARNNNKGKRKQQKILRIRLK